MRWLRAQLRRPGVALFALALVAYGYFYQAGGWNQNPRLLGPIVAWRTLGPRMLTTMLVPLIGCGAAYLYRINNASRWPRQVGSPG